GADGLVVVRLVVPDHQVAGAGCALRRIAARAGAEPDVVGGVVAAGGAVVGPRPAGRDGTGADLADRARQPAVRAGAAAVRAGEDRRVAFGRGRPGGGLRGHLELRAEPVGDGLTGERVLAPGVVLDDVLLRAGDRHRLVLRRQRALAARRRAA